MIKLENLTKKFGAFTAVDQINIEVERGQIFAFLGTNGAGKTTTIRMMTGVVEPTSGSVSVGGFDLKTHPVEAKFLMGVIPDRPYLYGKLTGREFLHFIAELYCVRYRDARERVQKLLTEYGLLEWQYDLIDTYSHGMKQRLALSAALVHEPALLVVDEPMVGLDPRGARMLKDTFRARAKEGLTIFMSTHSLSVAEEIADKLAIINRGKIVAIGTLEEIYAQTRGGPQDLEKVFLEIISDGQEPSGEHFT